MNKQKLTFYFDADVACEHGVNEAIFLKQLSQWIYTNECAGENYREGRTWSKISAEGMAKYFPFWTRKNIEYIRNKLVKTGQIIIEKFDKKRSDHTSYMTFSDECVYSNNYRPTVKETENIIANGNTYFPENGSSRSPEIGKPSLYINMKNTNKCASGEDAAFLFVNLWSEYSQYCNRDKKKSYEKFVKLKPTKEFTQELIQAIKNQAAQNLRLQQKGQFVPNWPYLVRWLGNERWKDDVHSASVKKQNVLMPMVSDE